MRAVLSVAYRMYIMLCVINTMLAVLLSLLVIWRQRTNLSIAMIVLCTVLPFITSFVKDKKQYFATPAILMLYVLVLLIY